jgi:uncharacterized protein (TIGR01777 family)
MKMKKIALLGGSGFIGSALQEHFDEVVLLKRGDSDELMREKLSNVDTVINLSGAPILKRWNENYKKLLYNSRINSTKRLVSILNSTSVKQLISTSAIAIYPSNRECSEECKELSDDFLGNLCRDWEREASEFNGTTTIVRIGVVLDGNGGALKKMLLPFKLNLGGVIGDGGAYMSWIALEDIIRVYNFLIENRLDGIYNAVSPNPVTNREFTDALAKRLRRGAFLPLPKFLLKLIYGEGASVIVDSKRIYPKNLLHKGFEFRYNDIESALNSFDI